MGQLASSEGSPTEESQLKKKSYHHGDLRNALMMAGLAIVEEEGVDQLNLRGVARRAGVSHAAPYRHFADKDALLAVIAEDGFFQLGELIAERLAACEKPVTESPAPVLASEQIIAISRAYVHFAQAHPALFRLMFSSIVGQRTKYPSLYTAAKQSFRELSGIIDHGQRRGELVQGSPDELATALWGIMHGLAMLLIENQIPTPIQIDHYPSTEEFTEVLLKRMLGGILNNKSSM